MSENPVSDQPTFDGFLKRLAKYNVPFNTVIDVGASDGRWTNQVLQAFPEPEYLLVEAQPEHEPALKEFSRDRSNTTYIISAVGDAIGKINFHGGGLFGGLASHTSFPEHNLVLDMTTLDALLCERAHKPPFFIKLDTHGFEKQILDGASETLRDTSLLVIEVYNHKMGCDNLLFHEMCAEMGKLGFRCIDMFDPLYRPYDSSLWQMDLAFARSDWAQFSHPAYL